MHQRRDVLTEAEAARAGDVFSTHQRFLESVARQHAGSQDEVPDIVQQVGLQICRGLNGYRGDSDLQTWLYRVTVNVARNHYRSERRHLLRPREAVQADPPADPVVDPDEQAAESQRKQALMDAIAMLKASHQDAMREEIAGSGVSTSRKDTRHRARRRLRELLADDPRLG